MFYFGSNTKRDLSIASHNAVATAALRLATEFKDAQIFLLPAMPLFPSLKAQAGGSRLWIGNQTVSGTSGRDVTGEVSARLLKSLHSDLVMIGHAERREFFDDESSVAAQLEQAAQSRLRILFCVGESRVTKDRKKLRAFLQRQLRPLGKIKAPLLVAYEPVFSIGARGKPADPDYVASAMEIIAEALDKGGKSRVPILYGGSVSAENAAAYAALPHCDGLFVGRSAWSARGFSSVFRAGYRGFFGG